MKKGKLKIFVAGARGFIGRNVVEYLTAMPDRYEVFYPYHKELELLDEAAARDYIDGKQIDIIISCAKVGGSRKTAYDAGMSDIIKKNTRMFFNLARALNPRRRMIFLGTGAEYDMRHYKPRMEEDYFGRHVPADDYGFSKYICSRYIERCDNIVNLRLFGVFGKYEDYEYRFISNSIVKNLLGMPIIIYQNIRYDYLYVADLTRIIGHFIERGWRRKFYNVVTGRTTDLLGIANKINRIGASPSEIIIKNKGLGVEYSGANQRLVSELKDFRFTPFDEALKELYEWYRSGLHSIDKDAVAKDEYIKHCRVAKAEAHGR